MTKPEDKKRGPAADAVKAGFGFAFRVVFDVFMYADRYHAGRVIMLAGLAGYS